MHTPKQCCSTGEHWCKWEHRGEKSHSAQADQEGFTEVYEPWKPHSHLPHEEQRGKGIPGRKHESTQRAWGTACLEHWVEVEGKQLDLKWWAPNARVKFWILSQEVRCHERLLEPGSSTITNLALLLTKVQSRCFLDKQRQWGEHVAESDHERTPAPAFWQVRSSPLLHRQGNSRSVSDQVIQSQGHRADAKTW